MSKKSFQKYLFEEKIKKSNPTLNIFNSSLYTQGKNTKKRIIDNEIGYKTINSSYINTFKNKNKLFIPKAIKNINFEKSKSKRKSENLNKFSSLKLKNFGNNFINRNYFDINNNNYYVNLYNDSTPNSIKNLKNIKITKKFDPIEKKALVNKMKYLNLSNLKKSIIFYFKKSKTDVKELNLIHNKNKEVKEKMKNYRNKLLLEFMKHINRFIIIRKKEIFEFLLNQIKYIPEKKISVSYIYKKKIKQISTKKFNNKLNTHSNSSDIKSPIINNDKENMQFLIISKVNRGIVNKKIHYQNRNYLGGEIKNVFLCPDFIHKNNYQKEEGTINKSFKGDIMSNNMRKKNIYNDDKTINNVSEIEINFKRIPQKKKIIIMKPKKSKIKLRFNCINYNWTYKNNIKKNFSNLVIQRFVDNFIIICKKDEINEFFGLRKRNINGKKDNKILPSIIEVDEKISGTHKDYIK